MLLSGCSILSHCFLVQKQEGEMKVFPYLPSSHKEKVFVGHSSSPLSVTQLLINVTDFGVQMNT